MSGSGGSGRGNDTTFWALGLWRDAGPDAPAWSVMEFMDTWEIRRIEAFADGRVQLIEDRNELCTVPTTAAEILLQPDQSTAVVLLTRAEFETLLQIPDHLLLSQVRV